MNNKTRHEMEVMMSTELSIRTVMFFCWVKMKDASEAIVFSRKKHS